MEIELALNAIETRKEKLNQEKNHSTEWLMGSSDAYEFCRNVLLALMAEEDKQLPEMPDAMCEGCDD
jgi:hypothetical protein